MVSLYTHRTDPSSIARYQLGDVLSATVVGHGFLRAQFYLDDPTSLRLSVAVPRGAVAGFYARRGAPPSYTTYDLFHVVDANKVVPPASGPSSSRQRRRSADSDDTAVRAISSRILTPFSPRFNQSRQLFDASAPNEGGVANLVPKSVTMATSLEESEKGQTDHLQSNIYHLVEKS